MPRRRDSSVVPAPARPSISSEPRSLWIPALAQGPGGGRQWPTKTFLTIGRSSPIAIARWRRRSNAGAPRTFRSITATSMQPAAILSPASAATRSVEAQAHRARPRCTLPARRVHTVSYPRDSGTARRPCRFCIRHAGPRRGPDQPVRHREPEQRRLASNAPAIGEAIAAFALTEQNPVRTSPTSR